MIKLYSPMVYAAMHIIREQSQGEWDDNTIEKGAGKLVRLLIDNTSSHPSPDDFYVISYDFVEEQSEGEWPEYEIDKDARAIGEFLYNFCCTVSNEVSNAR